MARSPEVSGSAVDYGSFALCGSPVVEEVRRSGQRDRAAQPGKNRRSQADWDAEAEELKARIIASGGIPGYCPLRAARVAQDILRRLGEL